MPDKELPACPSLEQYKKQAKDLNNDFNRAIPDALARLRRHHPRFYKLRELDLSGLEFSRADAQFVLAREHGFESWPKFAKHVEMLQLIRSVTSLKDPVAAFIEVACVPRHCGHGSGTLEHAEMILARYPQVAESSIYTAAILADETTVRRFLAHNPRNASLKGGPHGWDALTYLCFSRYLRIDQARSEAFVRTAQALLDAGASAMTGWIEIIDQPTPRPTWESILYGAAGVARHADLTRLLLERGADPNDEETPYHVPEGYDNTVMKIVLESGKLNETSLAWMLLRKADWHDEEGLRLLLKHGANPNLVPKFGNNALHHALRRDNSLAIIELLLDFGADTARKNAGDGRSAASIAAHRGRGDVLAALKRRGAVLELNPADHLMAACALDDSAAIGSLAMQESQPLQPLLADGGSLLAEFAGNGNVGGLCRLLELGVSVTALYKEGDAYFDIAKNSTALHVAAWRARHSAVQKLIELGAPVNALDGKGRTALALAVKAGVDSYWKNRRSPESVEALLRAGATTSGIDIPSGYEEVDQLLRQYKDQSTP